jgi:hypothetical protein
VTFELDTLRRRLGSLRAASGRLSAIAAELARIPPAVREERLAEALRLLAVDVLPRLEQVIDSRLEVDRRAIGEWADRLVASSSDDVDELQRLLYGLAALVEVAVETEERLLVPQLESRNPLGRAA